MKTIYGFRYSCPLHIGRDRPGNGWEVLAYYYFEASVDHGDGKVIRTGYAIPVGFKTDFASVPRLFRSIVSKIGKHAEAAVIHDWMYVAVKRKAHLDGKGITVSGEVAEWRFERRYADDVFRAAMKEAGVGWLKRQAMWSAVRIGGGFVRGKL